MDADLVEQPIDGAQGAERLAEKTEYKDGCNDGQE